MREWIRSYINFLHLMTTSQSCQQHFHPVHYINPGVQWGAHNWCSESEQPVLYSINSDTSATGAQLRVACIQRWLPAYPPVSGFQIPFSEENDIRVVQIAEMVKETKNKSSSIQAYVTLPIFNSSVVLTASTTCYENPCLTIHLKILILYSSTLYLIVSISIFYSNTTEPDSFTRLMKPGIYSYQTKTTATGLSQC